MDHSYQNAKIANLGGNLVGGAGPSCPSESHGVDKCAQSTGRPRTRLEELVDDIRAAKIDYERENTIVMALEEACDRTNDRRSGAWSRLIKAKHELDKYAEAV